MAWEIEYTDEFSQWHGDISNSQREDVAAMINLLAEIGVRLGFPKTSGVNGSRHSHMRELRIQSGGRPFRVFYAFDPLRTAIILDRRGQKGY